MLQKLLGVCVVEDLDLRIVLEHCVVHRSDNVWSRSPEDVNVAPNVFSVEEVGTAFDRQIDTFLPEVLTGQGPKHTVVQPVC